MRNDLSWIELQLRLSSKANAEPIPTLMSRTVVHNTHQILNCEIALAQAQEHSAVFSKRVWPKQCNALAGKI